LALIFCSFLEANSDQYVFNAETVQKLTDEQRTAPNENPKTEVVKDRI